MTQRFSSNVGQVYQLSFDAYSGNWHGSDTDVVQVLAGDMMKLLSISNQHHVNEGDPSIAYKAELTFTAIDNHTNLSFYSDINHCIDIDNVSVIELPFSDPLTWETYRQVPEFIIQFPFVVDYYHAIVVKKIRRQKKAERLVYSIRKMGFDAHMIPITGEDKEVDKWIVYIGPYHPQQQSYAKKVLKQVRRAGMYTARLQTFNVR